jgi:3',5'-cyclic-AMP phosphodiesterase
MSELSRRGFLAAAGLGVATVPLLGTSAAFASTRSTQPVDVITSIDVISDVQGDLADFGDALTDLRSLGSADALVINGDLVRDGLVQQYEEFYAKLASVPHPSRVLAALGNHEQYNTDPFDVQVSRFLHYTGMPDVYSTTTVGSLPLVFIGTTAPAPNGTMPPWVTLGVTQLAWLERTLASYANHPYVLVFSHHVLPGTVSGTVGPDRGNFYDKDFIDEAELLRILGAHPNVVFFSGHTHWDLRREDWAARKIVSGGHPSGFAVVNTGFIQTVFVPDGKGNAYPGSKLESQGLRVLLGANGKLCVQSRDFMRNELIRTLHIEPCRGR